jgi:hypothetical protein
MQTGTGLLYLHCGWPRTGTTSLQRALHESRAELAQAGILYPERWQTAAEENDFGHHGLVDFLTENSDTEQAISDFYRYLGSRQHPVLLSTESISNWLERKRLPALMRWLGLVRGVTNLRCLWTLRRMDELFASIYLHELRGGLDQQPQEYFRNRLEIGWIEEIVYGMAQLRGSSNWATVCTAYQPDGKHLGQLLSAVAVPETLRNRILKLVKQGPRWGVRLTHKAALTLLHRDALSKRAGVEISWTAVVEALRDGELVFNHDSQLEVVDPAIRRQVHCDALDACRKHYFQPYIDFYENDETPDMPASSMEVDVLTEDDIESISAAVEPTAATRAH